ncbi:hypothetical protein CCAX7_48240 [Capsulimonas corticalis]|uniref:Flagellar hook-length control protein-like C-terminal domain-containing protein n=1 Tax=Capsulimonas corticalis TaxID=2219043 RepID=A0A402CQ15_9BACT|nr:flagellar hook-length control protein FliK [Capsulimonas corticalis]BDI32773.1 hypothetical protein CCAX7_48240 [Capsulimonas corticalis]
MPLDIMSGFSGGAASTGAAQTGAPPVSGSEPTVTFASLLTGKATDSPQGAVAKSGEGPSAKKDDDSKSDTTGDATPTLDPSLAAQNLVLPTVTAPIMTPPTPKKSEPNVPSTTEPLAGKSVAMDTSSMLSRPTAVKSATGGELLSTLKQTLDSAASAGAVAPASALKTTAQDPASAIAAGQAAAPVIASEALTGVALPKQATAKTDDTDTAKGAAVPQASTKFGTPSDIAAAAEISAGFAGVSNAHLQKRETSLLTEKPAPSVSSPVSPVTTGVKAATNVAIPTIATLEPLKSTPLEASLLKSAQPAPDTAQALTAPLTADKSANLTLPVGSAAPATAEKLLAPTPASLPATDSAPLAQAAASTSPIASAANSQPASATVSVQTIAAAAIVPAAANSLDISSKLPLRKIPGLADNKTVNDAKALTKGAAKVDTTSLLQSLNGKASISSKSSALSPLSEALVKAEITTDGKKNGSDVTSQAMQTSSETGNTTLTIQDQHISVPMPAQDRAAMITKVVDKIGEMKLDAQGKGGDKVTLQLHPQDWGQLNLTVTMTPKVDASGQTTTMVTAHVAAENPVVKQALESHLNDLRRSLNEQGLKLDTLTVTVDTVSAASASAQSGGSGLMSGHHPSNDGSQTQTSQSQAQSGGFDGSNQGQRAFADFGAGQFGGGQRGQQSQQPSWTAHDADLDTVPTVAAIRSNASGRVDVRA